MMRINLPITDEQIESLKVGDIVSLNGIILTARDRAHKYFIENFIQLEQPLKSEYELHDKLQQDLRGGAIYHCGPVVRKKDRDGRWQFVAAGPTTSIREEPYQSQVIKHFDLKAVIGKGGMGEKTLAACKENKAVYLHAIGGAASLIAHSVKEVIDVYKIEFGIPEAIWKIRVEDFQATVTMDAHGNSLHKQVKKRSARFFDNFILDGKVSASQIS